MALPEMNGLVSNTGLKNPDVIIKDISILFEISSST